MLDVFIKQLKEDNKERTIEVYSVRNEPYRSRGLTTCIDCVIDIISKSRHTGIYDSPLRCGKYSCERYLAYWLSSKGINNELIYFEQGLINNIPEYDQQFRLTCLIASILFAVPEVSKVKRLLRLCYPELPIDLIC